MLSERDRITPDLEWAKEVAADQGMPARCPYASIHRCPRYFQSLSLLGEKGITTPLDPDRDAAALAHWKRSDLWPETLEKAPSVSGFQESPRKSFANFCPEVAFDHFGYFAETLLPYASDDDLMHALESWTDTVTGPNHWHTSWSYVSALHYSECPLYSLLEASGQGSRRLSGNPGFLRKIAVLCKDFYSLREIDDLFIFAGAEPSERLDPREEHGSERMDRVYGWARGIGNGPPGRMEEVLLGVAAQLVENSHIPESDRSFLRRQGHIPAPKPDLPTRGSSAPSTVEELVERVIRGLARATRPLRHRRKGAVAIDFSDEYDIQSLFHALISPWVKDIRPEEYTPSYAGSSTRVDFLLADYGLVVELKYVRDRTHAKKVGDELVLDVAHYRAHPKCRAIWAVIYDPSGLIENPDGLGNDLDGEHTDGRGEVEVRTFVIQP